MLNWELFLPSQETVGQKFCKFKQGSVAFRLEVKMRDEGCLKKTEVPVWDSQKYFTTDNSQNVPFT